MLSLAFGESNCQSCPEEINGVLHDELVTGERKGGGALCLISPLGLSPIHSLPLAFVPELQRFDWESQLASKWPHPQ